MGKLFTRRTTFEKFFEAEGRTDWKSKKSLHVLRCSIFHRKSVKSKKNDKKSLDSRQELGLPVYLLKVSYETSASGNLQVLCHQLMSLYFCKSPSLYFCVT